MISIQESYRYCIRLARKRARNFYFSFMLLPRLQRDAICAMYAFMRYCDDLSDDDEQPRTVEFRRAAIGEWRRALEAALGGQCPEHPIWPAFADAVQRYKIPHELFFQMIEGVESDLEPRRIQTFEELYDYCYKVAAVVGLTVIYIFRFDSSEAPLLAEKCGIAFQLTNVIRDVREDASKDRIYLPAEDMERFGVCPAELVGTRGGEGFRKLMAFEAGRARAYYEESRPLIAMVSPESRSSMWALIEIYSRLLSHIELSNYDVLSRRIELATTEKLWIATRAACGLR